MADCLVGDCLEVKRKQIEKAKENVAYKDLLKVFERLTDLTERSVTRIASILKPVPLSPYMEEKFQQGLPLVDRRNFPVRDTVFESLFTTFIEGLSGIGDSVDKDLVVLREKLGQGVISGRRFIDQFVMGSENFFPYIFKVPDVNHSLLFLVTRNVFKICLIPFQDVLTDELAMGWERGECPVCGFPPDMGALRGEGGKLFLHCAICGHEWRFRRMACAFCGRDLQSELHTLEVEGDEVHKVHLCHLCKRYLKVVDTRKLPENTLVFLDLEELTTFHLDIVADQKGYAPGINL